MLTRLIANAIGVLAHLAANPWLLFAVAFAANAVFLPYHGLYHDAVLYAGQVLHSADGRFADDLFFRYGSQNDYTLLPRLLAPLALRFGVEPVFFAAYLVSNALRLAASQMLVFRLLGRSPATVAGVVLIAVANVPVGCSVIFRVNEPFFTARVPALALSILGLERLLAGRWLVASACLLLGLIAHPLMTLPAILIATAWLLGGWATTPTRKLAVGGVAALALLLGTLYLVRTAGSLDPDWRMLVLAQNSYLDPSRWKPWDILRLGLIGAAVVATAKTADVPTQRFLWLTVVAAATGYLVSTFAARGSWALLLQGQAYRAVWLLELLGFPAGMALLARLWNSGPDGQTRAVALFVVLLAGKDLFAVKPVILLLAAIGLGFVFTRGADRAKAIAVGFGIWAVVWYGCWLPVSFAPVFTPPVSESVGWAHRFEPLFWGFGAVPRFALTLLGIGLMLKFLPSPRAASTVAISFGLVVSVVAFELPRSHLFDPRRADYAFVKSHLPPDRTPTLYWPAGRLAEQWTHLGVNVYVNSYQMPGVTFSRPFAVEGFRRMGLVIPFEHAELVRLFGDNISFYSYGEDVSGVYRTPQPTMEEFHALVAEPNLDFLVLSQDFGGSLATNGRVWLYDCHMLRAAK